jgi:S-formylglutathione hydrolase FrmB
VNVGLFDPSISLTICAVTSALATYVLMQYKRDWYVKILPFILAAAIVAAILVQLAVGRITESADELPGNLWAMVLPFTASVGLCIWLAMEVLKERLVRSRKRKKIRWRLHHAHIYAACALMTAGSLVFAFTLLNNYYKYFPTISSVFGGSPVVSQGSTVVQYSSKAQAIQRKSVEATVAALDSRTSGTVSPVEIPGTVSGFAARGAYVYQPAVTTLNNGVQLPVLVMLAGLPGQPQDWLNGGAAQQTLDDFAKGHDGVTPLVFFVDDTGTFANDTECVDSPRGNVETYLTVDVPNYIKSHYHVMLDPSNWGVAGLSMGGTCAINLVLDHPNVYRVFGDYSGELGAEIGSEAQTVAGLFGGSKAEWAAHQPNLLLKKPGAAARYKGVSGYFGNGRGDSLAVTSAMKTLYMESKKDGLDVGYEAIEGEHTFAVWKQNFEDSLPWLSYRLGATECTTGCKP